MRNKILLVTSIAPFDIDNQLNAIYSWKEFGFDIISCNTKEEIDQLKDKFPFVVFKTIIRDSYSVNGKHCPYIYDMLESLNIEGYDVVGIINSDIHLRFVTKELYEYIYRQSSDKLVFVRRKDVENSDAIEKGEGILFFGGIDLFFFPKELISKIKDDGLTLGQAMWDYWLIIISEKLGIGIRELTNPIAYHISHVTRWSDNLTEILSKKICDRNFPEITGDYTFYLKDRFFEIISSGDNQVCYIDERLKNKILAIETDIEDVRIALKKQWKNLIFYPLNSKTDGDYHYKIKIPYKTNLGSTFCRSIVWLFNCIQLDQVEIPVYFTEKQSRISNIENCSIKLVNKFNRAIFPIIASKKDMSFENNAGIFYSYIATVNIEDNKNLIWNNKGQNVSGKIAIAPAGYMARRWIRRYKEFLKDIEVECWLDNNASLNGKKIMGIEVFKPGDISVNKIVVISNLYTEEIIKQLKNVYRSAVIIEWNEFDEELWLKSQEYH